MKFTFSVDIGDSPEVAQIVLDAITNVVLKDTLDIVSQEWIDLVTRTRDLATAWTDKLMTITDSWTEWMVSR